MPKIPKLDSQLVCADSRQYLREHVWSNSIDFVFMDPPFNIGQDYENYDDTISDEAFRKLLEELVEQCWRVCGGVLALHGPDGLVEEYLRLARKYGMTRIDWVNWHYRFGMSGSLETRRRFTDSRCHCLIFAKNPKNYVFNASEIAVDSDRKAVYNDKRTREDKNGTARGGKRVPFTVWGIPSDGPNWGRVMGNNEERESSRPNQLPELYLTRLIKAYTNKGDSVLDPCSGTGTTAVVAGALGRVYLGIDIDPAAIECGHKRLKKGAVRTP